MTTLLPLLPLGVGMAWGISLTGAILTGRAGWIGCAVIAGAAAFGEAVGALLY